MDILTLLACLPLRWTLSLSLILTMSLLSPARYLVPVKLVFSLLVTRPLWAHVCQCHHGSQSQGIRLRVRVPNALRVKVPVHRGVRVRMRHQPMHRHVRVTMRRPRPVVPLLQSHVGVDVVPLGVDVLHLEADFGVGRILHLVRGVQGCLSTSQRRCQDLIVSLWSRRMLGSASSEIFIKAIPLELEASGGCSPPGTEAQA